jgi:hypothetical protein
VIRLDAGTVLLQWAAGGLAFLWVTTRHREVGLGYGWLVRGTFAVFAATAVVVGVAVDPVPVRDAAAAGVTLAALGALAVSIVRRRAGVSRQHMDHDRRSARVAAMTGIERAVSSSPSSASLPPAPTRFARQSVLRRPGGARRSRTPPNHEPADQRGRREFPPALDLVAPAIGVIGLVAAGVAAGGDDLLAVARTLAGAAFLGAVTDAMLLGHWYLVQPGLRRALLDELVTWVIRVWPVEVGLLLVPTGMVSVLNGSIDDGWGGTLGWFWVACAVATLVLAMVTRAALKERQYSAVMAATGLLYLAILTAFGTDLVARAVLA